MKSIRETLFNNISLRDSPLVLRREVMQAIRKKQPEPPEQTEDVIFHLDNAPAHTAAIQKA